MRLPPRRRATALLASLSLMLMAPAVTAQASPTPTAPAAPAAQQPASVPSADRAATLPAGWQSTADRAVVTDGDSTGLHVLVADEKDAYTWRTAATLSEPGAQTSQWIGQSCVTGSGDRAVVVYAPREAVNDENLFHAGGLVAVVDLTTGAVRKLPMTVSLAYYDPACGAGETVELTENLTAANGDYISRLITVDTTTGAVTRSSDAVGQVTSAVPTASGVVASKGSTLVSIDADGSEHALVNTVDAPFRLSVDPQGAVGYEVQSGGKTELHRYAAGRDSVIGKAPQGSVQLHQVAGHVFVQGKDVGKQVNTSALPTGWQLVAADPTAQLSSQATLAVTDASNETDKSTTPLAVTPGDALPVSISTTVLPTGKHPAFSVWPNALRPADGAAPTPAVIGAGATVKNAPKAAGVDASTMTTDPDRGCAVARNDPHIESLQPTPQMGEWAADLAVKGALTVQRPAGWNGSSLPAYTPQGMFPPHPLIGGGQVPAQILLGVMAQESNMWQAGPDTVDGESGNFETGGFYGKNVGVNSVNFANVDCGYGATQVTTGMNVAVGSTIYSPTQQLAIAVDYAANIAAGLEILQDKWNYMKQVGVVANDANPAELENWWFALWAYNSGYHDQHVDPSGQYGLGWANNMADEDFPADRAGFLDAGYGDAKTPNHWSYPERVMGWAAHALLRLNWKTGVYGPAYATATWPQESGGGAYRPPLGQFCTSDNQCDMSQTHKPGDYPTDPGSHCLLDDLKCWWHQSTTWNVACNALCGRERITYQPGSPEPSTAGKQLYKPDCTADAELPGNALVVDDVAPDVRTNTGCARDWTNNGALTWKFGADSAGHYPSKIDFHQLDTGFAGHMWTAHMWANTTANAKHVVTGTWTLNKQLNGWARVVVYIPDHAAMATQADYVVHGSDSTSPSRMINEGNYLDANRNPAPGHWVSLGAFNFTGTPSVSLDNLTHSTVDGDGGEKWVDDDRDIVWDAVAFEPLPGAPADQVVALGDSFSSGEGASNAPVSGVWDYYRDSDHDGQTKGGDNAEFQDACHRSPYNWSREMHLPDNPATVGARADSNDPTLNYHMSACSGATTSNMLSANLPVLGATGPRTPGQFEEGNQLDHGFLDQHTTLVTFSIGGNDARFTDVLTHCIAGDIPSCQNSTMPGDSAPLSTVEPQLINGAARSGAQAVLYQISQVAPNAKIMLMGYPELFSNGNSCTASVPQIDASTANWMDSMADLMDQALADVASTSRTANGINVTYVDPRNAFSGKEICGNPADIHSIVSDLTRGDPPPKFAGTLPISDQSCHPTVAGAALYASVATSALTTMNASRATQKRPIGDR
jgi:hypothetical protein